MAGAGYAQIITQAIQTQAKVQGAVLSYEGVRLSSKYNKAIIDANNTINQSIYDMQIRRIRDEGESMLGTQRAMIAKSGTKFSGSNLEVFKDSLKNIELDVISVELNKMIANAQSQQAIKRESIATQRAKAALPLQIMSALAGGSANIASSQSSNIAQRQTGGGASSGPNISTSSGSGYRNTGSIAVSG